MADTAKRLAGPTQLSGSATTIYTVPGSTTAIVRSILVCNTDSLSFTFTLSIGADAAGTRLWLNKFVEAGETFEYHGFIVLDAAQIIQAYSDTANKLTLTLSGVEVT